MPGSSCKDKKKAYCTGFVNEEFLMNCKNKIELVWIYSEKGETVFDLSANVYVRIADDVYMKMMHAFYINSRFLYRIEKKIFIRDFLKYF